MRHKKNIILLIVLISFVVKISGQNYRLPDWNKTTYKETIRPLRLTILSAKPVKIETKLILYNNNKFTKSYTVYGNQISLSMFGYKLTPEVEVIDSGYYFSSSDTLNLKFSDSTLVYIKNKRKLVNIGNRKKLKLENPTRLGVGLYYGSFDFGVSMRADIFLFEKKNLYLGFNTGVFITNLTFGASVGYQFKSFISEVEFSYLTYPKVNQNNEIPWVFSINPKIGFNYHGLFIKASPSFILNKKTDNTLYKIDLKNIPIKLELGYFFKFGTFDNF